MKQIIQSLADGKIKLEDVPTPLNTEGHVLIQSSKSLVSAGTERMLINFGRGNYIEKALQQPAKVKEVINKIKTDGLSTTISAVNAKLEEPMTLGYSNSGIIIDSSVEGFKVGDRVISNGPHSEVVRVPKNLCAKIPDIVDDESASFTVLGSIALQGIRLANPTLGENIVVTGLGLIGLITVQMLIANGCRVIGIDFDSERCKLAKLFGAEVVDLSAGQDPIGKVSSFTKGNGADAVIITASSKSNDIVHQAAVMSRKRGRIILVGVVGLELNRDDFYEKELSFQVSSSYGPGRYDENYEFYGNDYPIGFVRWTEKRNFEAVLEMMEKKLLNVQPLISHRYIVQEAEAAYDQLEDPSSLGIILDYQQLDKTKANDSIISIKQEIKSNFQKDKPSIGLIGGGNYASRVLIPAISSSKAHIKTIVTSKGVSAIYNAKKASIGNASSDYRDVLTDDEINTIVIATRHDSHAELVIESLKAGKNIFVEKPLALTMDSIEAIARAYEDCKSGQLNPPRVMVGFNRRFSPHIEKIKSFVLTRSDQLSMIMTVNAGHIPSDHWTQDRLIGGGRVIGEVCHFIDLLSFLSDSEIDSFSATPLLNESHESKMRDTITITLSFKNGSHGTIHYFSNGDNSFPKERLEIFSGSSIIQLDNFKSIKGYNCPELKKFKTRKQDKGQDKCIKVFLDSIKDGQPSPISFEEIIHCSVKTIEIADILYKS